MINQYYNLIDVEEVKPLCFTMLHGESANLTFSLERNGEVIPLNGFSCKLYYNTKDNADNEWYEANGTINTSTNTISFNWLPTMDNGASQFNWFVRVQGTNATDISYRICGKFIMRNSPNFTPNEIELPLKVLNFADIQVLNAPYYLKSYIDNMKSSIDTEIEAINEQISGITGGGISASQIHDKDKTAGMVLGAWNTSSNAYYFDGYVNYYFDSGMYNEGQGAFRITIPNGLYLNGVDLGGQVVEGVCDWEFVSDYGNWSGHIYRSKTTFNVAGLDLYVFASLNLSSIIQKQNLSTPIWVGVGLSKDPNDYSNSIEVVTAEFDASSSYAPINTTMYEQSGDYALLTERCLRDTATGVAYALSVTNGELHLTPYKETKFEE